MMKKGWREIIFNWKTSIFLCKVKINLTIKKLTFQSTLDRCLKIKVFGDFFTQNVSKSLMKLSSWCLLQGYHTWFLSCTPWESWVKPHQLKRQSRLFLHAFMFMWFYWSKSGLSVQSNVFLAFYNGLIVKETQFTKLK